MCDVGEFINISVDVARARSNPDEVYSEIDYGGTLREVAEALGDTVEKHPEMLRILLGSAIRALYAAGYIDDQVAYDYMTAVFEEDEFTSVTDLVDMFR